MRPLAGNDTRRNILNWIKYKGPQDAAVTHGRLDITVGLDSGFVDANVVDLRNDPVEGVTVVLVPTDPRRKRSDLYKSETSNESGGVRFDGVAPGDYKVFAWKDVPRGSMAVCRIHPGL